MYKLLDTSFLMLLKILSKKIAENSNLPASAKLGKHTAENKTVMIF